MAERTTRFRSTAISKRWLDPFVVTEEAVAALLTVYPAKEMTAWPVRPKFNYGDPCDEGIIEPVAEMQKPGL